MIRCYWDSLRVHDEVLVHDDTDPQLEMLSGDVTSVATRATSNTITIRVNDHDGSTHTVHPNRLAVHLRSGDSRADCWRCALSTPRQPMPAA